MKVLLQNTNTHEVRTINHACMLTDTPVFRASLEMLKNIFDFKIELQRGDMMPVGSVEFVREVFKIMDIEEPEFKPYPEALDLFLFRNLSIKSVSYIRTMVKDRYKLPLFLKPLVTKKFNGFILDPLKAMKEYNDHDKEQLLILETLSYKDLVYVSDCVEFQSEYRYYVDKNTILGYTRYDSDGLDNAPEPNSKIVLEMIRTFNYQNPYALDVGVLKNGQTCLVECNDAWALGLYGHSLSPRVYLEFLGNRWKTIVNKSLT